MDIEIEIWKPIKGYVDCYSISNKGRVRSEKRIIECIYPNNSIRLRPIKERYIKPLNKKGTYPQVALNKNKKTKTATIHRLIAEAFIDNPDNKSQVNHKNGNKNDNRLENLEWVTCSENINHAYDLGLKPNNLGERFVMSKLKKEEVLRIRELAKQGISDVKLAEIFKVSPRNIGYIRDRKSWRRI